MLNYTPSDAKIVTDGKGSAWFLCRSKTKEESFWGLWHVNSSMQETQLYEYPKYSKLVGSEVFNIKRSVQLGSIYFSQSSINSTFNTGGSVYDLPSNETMQVVNHNGKYFTMNNRTLFALKKNYRRYHTVTVYEIDKTPKFWDKFTTNNGGTWVEVC